MSCPCAIFCSTVDQSKNSCFCISLLWPEIAPTLLGSTFTFREWQTLIWPWILQLCDPGYMILNYLGSSGVVVSSRHGLLCSPNSFLFIEKHIRSAFFFHDLLSTHMGKIVTIHDKNDSLISLYFRLYALQQAKKTRVVYIHGFTEM